VTKQFQLSWRGLFLAWAILLPLSVQAGPAVQVRYTEGLIRGFVVLRALDGKILAHGDLAQVARGERVTTHLVLSFKDGSTYDETVQFSQQGSFRLQSYRLVQKGPVYKVPMEMTIESSTGEVVVKYAGKDGKQRVERERLQLPTDVMNGMVPILLKNIPPGSKRTTVSLVAAAPKPRLVSLVVTPEGEAEFLAGGAVHKATQYRIKMDIGGILGFLAPLVGKEPEESRAWVLDGDAPAFVRMEGPLFVDGPSWRFEPASPVWHED
jgi:hypothetical protein